MTVGEDRGGDPASTATAARVTEVWAATFIDELARSGVTTVCLSPGSRSTPLVLQAASHPDLRVVTHLDERSAAFFALGVGKATRRPAAVLTTSGTAAANLFPAVVEAAQAGVPLIALTADRPHRLRDADANQAIDQIHLFGRHVRRFFEVAPPSPEARQLRHLRALAARAVMEATGDDPGPVHLNFPFDKPLEPPSSEKGGGAAVARPGGAPFTRPSTGSCGPSTATIRDVAGLLARSRRGVIVAGPCAEPWRTGPALLRLGAAAGLPVLADPLSGARFGPDRWAARIATYDLFLRSPDVATALRPDLVLRFGAAPTSAALGRYLEEARDAIHITVDGGRRWKDHAALATHYHREDPGHLAEALAEAVPEGDGGWRDLWLSVEDASSEAAAPEGDELTEPRVLTAALRAAADHGWLFVSNSMPVRDLDGFGHAGGAEIRALANRGASGIDGVVSTAAGVSAGAGTPVVCVLGDLAFYHDMNGLLATRERDVRVVYVVIHNDGGGIFHLLPVRAFEPAFTDHFATPHGLDFRHTAALYDLPYQRVQQPAELETAVRRATSAGGSHVLEVRTDREQNRLHRERVADRVVAAATRVLSQERDA